MSYQIKQSSTAYPLVFLMVDSTDHVTGKTGLSPTVTISKAGAAFAAPAGAVTEIGSGWYKVAGNATDSATLGPLILHATGTAADPSDAVFEVVAHDVQDATSLGLSRLDAAVTTRMATYTQPTGFLAATFPTTVASTTNITAGTITTVTNLTNLPTIPANWLTAAGIATGALTATKFAAGAIDAAALATDAVDEIRDGVWAKVQTELTGDPGATPTVLQSLALPYMAIRNKRDTDSGLGTDEIHNSAGSVILTATISDAAGVFSKAKYA